MRHFDKKAHTFMIQEIMIEPVVYKFLSTRQLQKCDLLEVVRTATPVVPELVLKTLASFSLRSLAS